MPPSIIRKWSIREIVKTLESTRSSGRLHASHIDDLVQLKKGVALCYSCERRYGKGVEKYGYTKRRIAGHLHITGNCDGCMEQMTQCTLYLTE